MVSKEKIKNWLILGLIVLISQITLFSEESRNEIIVKLINNTDYSLWLRVWDPGCILRSAECTEEYWDVFGRWKAPSDKPLQIVSRDDAPRGKAYLYYEKDPGYISFTYKTVKLKFKGEKSSADPSEDIEVTIQAEPVDITQYSLLYGTYTTTWYNYTITVNPKTKDTSEKKFLGQNLHKMTN